MRHIKDDEFRSWTDNLITQREIPTDAVIPPPPPWTAYDLALAVKNAAKQALNRALTVFIAKYIDNAVIFHEARDTPPADPEELSHSPQATRTPHTLTFTEAEREKRVYAALVWRNEKGGKGSFSQIKEAFIP